MLEKGIFDIKNILYDHANRLYEHIRGAVKRKHWESTNIGESYQIRGGRKDRLFLPERHESDDAGKRGFESI